MIEMAKAWDKGINTKEFKKTDMSDLNFIIDFRNAVNDSTEKKVDEQNRENKIMAAMQGLKNGRSR
jgi:hypothetical protein